MIKCKVNEGEKWESAEISYRAANTSEKNPHWWNIKNLSGNAQSLNLEQIYDFEIQQNISQESDILQQMSRLSLENNSTDTGASQNKNQVQKTPLVKNKHNILKAKQVELDLWKKERIDEGQRRSAFPNR